MGGPKGPLRGKKTHRADQLLNRGEHLEPDNTPTPEDRREAAENHLSRDQKKVKDEHPTGRMTEAGYKSQGGNRR